MIEEEIVDIVKHKIIYDGLDLADLGITRAEILDDTDLFNEDGLDLDSVDALEIIAGIQREFEIRFDNVQNDFIHKNCSTPIAIAATVRRFKETGKT